MKPGSAAAGTALGMDACYRANQARPLSTGSGCLCYKTAPAGKRLLLPEGSAAAAALQSGDGAGSKPGLRP